MRFGALTTSAQTGTNGHFIGAILPLWHKSIWIYTPLKIFPRSRTTPEKNVGKVGIFCGSPPLPSSMLNCCQSKSHKIVKRGSNIDKGGAGGPKTVQKWCLLCRVLNAQLSDIFVQPSQVFFVFGCLRDLGVVKKRVF